MEHGTVITINSFQYCQNLSSAFHLVEFQEYSQNKSRCGAHSMLIVNIRIVPGSKLDRRATNLILGLSLPSLITADLCRNMFWNGVRPPHLTALLKQLWSTYLIPHT